MLLFLELTNHHYLFVGQKLNQAEERARQEEQKMQEERDRKLV
jgi:hypothetical protein